MESPFLEMFKRCVDVALREMGLLVNKVEARLMFDSILKVFLNLKYSMKFYCLTLGKIRI